MNIKKELKELNSVFEKKDLIQKNILDWLQKNYEVLFYSDHSLFDLIDSIENGLNFLISNQCLRIKSVRIKIPVKGSWKSEATLTGNSEGITESGNSLEYVNIKMIKKNLEIYLENKDVYKLGIMLDHPDVIQEEFSEWIKLLKEFLKIYNRISLPKENDDVLLDLSLGSYELCMMNSNISLKHKDTKMNLSDLLFEEDDETSSYDNFSKKEKNKAIKYLIKHSVLFIEALNKMKETKLRMIKDFSVVNEKLKQRNKIRKTIKLLKEA